jgi:predicted transcriptional regulator
MDIQAEKIRLIEWLAGLNDSETLREFLALKKAREEDWWDLLSDQERQEIYEGLEQADKGELIPHKEIMEKFKQWL